MKLGCSPYLNALPLTRGLGAEHEVELTTASPARLADLLREGRLDASLVSSSEYFCGDYAIIPGAAISSQHASADAVLYAHKPYSHLRRIALSAASRSTNLMLRVLLKRLCPGAVVSYEVRPEDAFRSLKEFDGCLLIGDGALCEHEAAEYRYGLAGLWYEQTGLPMVFTLWLARPDADPAIVQAVRRAAERGLAALPQIAHEASAVRGLDETAARTYLTETLDYTWTKRHEESLLLFGAELCALGLCCSPPPLRYFTEATGRAQTPVETNQAT